MDGLLHAIPSRLLTEWMVYYDLKREAEHRAHLAAKSQSALEHVPRMRMRE